MMGLRSAIVTTLLPTTENAQEIAEEDATPGSSADTRTSAFLRRYAPPMRKIASSVGKKFGRRSTTRTMPELCHDPGLRLLDRDGPCHQSQGHWAVNNIAMRHTEDDEDERYSDWGQQLRNRMSGDLYHVFLDSGLWRQLTVLALAYMFVIVLFACLYLAIATHCKLDLEGSFIRAYMLSLETMITIGFGVPDPYMNGCWRGTIVLTTQSLLQLFMVAILIGVIFQRLSRPQSRACTILFSKRAVIQEIEGVHYFMFRVCDLRVHHALLETHVRCYCAHNDPQRGYELLPMRLEHPDDELGGSLLLNIPFIVVHRIDAWSPLAPQLDEVRSVALASDGLGDGQDIYQTDPRWSHQRMRINRWPGTFQRRVDCETGNRQGCVCPTCGSSFNTARMLELHCKYNAQSDLLNNQPEECRHKELSNGAITRLTSEDPTRQEIRDHLEHGFREVIVIVEGIEPTTSATVQARHSYSVGKQEAGGEPDMRWDMVYADCVTLPDDSSKGLVLDYSKFHRLQPAAY